MYDSFSQEYDHFVNWPNRLAFELPFLVEQIAAAIYKPVETIRILDTATGTGMHAIALAQKGYSVSGMDISEGMVTIARQNAAALNTDVFFTTAAFGNIAERSYAHPEGEGPSLGRRSLPGEFPTARGRYRRSSNRVDGFFCLPAPRRAVDPSKPQF